MGIPCVEGGHAWDCHNYEYDRTLRERISVWFATGKWWPKRGALKPSRYK